MFPVTSPEVGIAWRTLQTGESFSLSSLFFSEPFAQTYVNMTATLLVQDPFKERLPRHSSLIISLFSSTIFAHSVRLFVALS